MDVPVITDPQLQEASEPLGHSKAGPQSEVFEPRQSSAQSLKERAQQQDQDDDAPHVVDPSSSHWHGQIEPMPMPVQDNTNHPEDGDVHPSNVTLSPSSGLSTDQLMIAWYDNPKGLDQTSLSDLIHRSDFSFEALARMATPDSRKLVFARFAKEVAFDLDESEAKDMVLHELKTLPDTSSAPTAYIDALLVLRQAKLAKHTDGAEYASKVKSVMGKALQLPLEMTQELGKIVVSM